MKYCVADEAAYTIFLHHRAHIKYLILPQVFDTTRTRRCVHCPLVADTKTTTYTYVQTRLITCASNRNERFLGPYPSRTTTYNTEGAIFRVS